MDEDVLSEERNYIIVHVDEGGLSVSEQTTMCTKPQSMQVLSPNHLPCLFNGHVRR